MSQKISKTITYLSIIIIVIGSIFLANGLILAIDEWNPPTCNPPDCNVPAPINVGSTDQTKSGSLTVDDIISTTDGGYGSAGAVNFDYHSLNSHSSGWLYLGDQNNIVYGGRGFAAANLYAATNLYAYGVRNCSGKLYTDSDGKVLCGTDDVDTDTNASTECDGNWIFLDGNGNCRNSSDMSVYRADYGRYVYDNGAYSGSAAWREPSSMYVYYSYLGRLVYDNNTYGGGAGWKEPTDLGVKYSLNSSACSRDGTCEMNSASVGGNLTVTGVAAANTSANVGNTGHAYRPYGGNWDYNLLLHGSDYTSIGFHDSGATVHSIQHIGSTFFIGLDDGWGTANVKLGGRLTVGGSIDYIGGQGPFCIFANACPNGWVDKTTAGFLVWSWTCPYSAGAVFSGNWTWCHPKLCCNY